MVGERGAVYTRLARTTESFEQARARV